MTDLLTLFKAKRDEIGPKALAFKLGISDSAVRMVCTGNYPNPEKVLEKFAVNYIDPQCTYTNEPITRQDCDAHSQGHRPAGGNTRQEWWDACQTCPYKGRR